MKSINFNQLPEKLKKLINGILGDETRSQVSLSALMNTIDQQRTRLYQITLEKTQHQSSPQLRFIYREDYDDGFLLYKNEKGEYVCINTVKNENIELETAFRDITTLKVLTQTGHLGTLKDWDSLAVYRKMKSAESFYITHNHVTAACLFEDIKKSPATQPITVIDLGCGTGNMLSDFSNLCKNHSASDILWIGVDLSAENINLAKERASIINAEWIKADALAFAEHPEQFLSPLTLKRLQTHPVHIICSGLLNEGVLTFSDCVKLMQHMRHMPCLESLLLTGMTKLHVTPYIAKQIGFNTDLLDVADQTRKSIYRLSPMNIPQYIDRILKKAKKYGVLDLSYQTDLTAFNEFAENELTHVNYILLTGVPLTPAHMNLLNRWADQFPSLRFICSSTDRPAPEIYPTLCTSQHRWKFICISGDQSLNPFSPHFYHQMQPHREQGLPMQQHMEHYQKILMKRLFNALNEDNTPPNDAVIIAKNDIHKILCGVPVDTENCMTTDVFLDTIRKANVTLKLFDALENYVRLVHIPGFTDQELTYNDESHMNLVTKSIYADTSDQALYTATLLHKEGVLDDTEYCLVSDRIQQAQNVRLKKIF